MPGGFRLGGSNANGANGTDESCEHRNTIKTPPDMGWTAMLGPIPGRNSDWVSWPSIENNGRRVLRSPALVSARTIDDARCGEFQACWRLLNRS